ncbi:MAG: glycosyltransferase family A protein, partial [Nitrososphaerota archaeon]
MSNQDKPLVTFAVFAYNQEQFIRQAIAGAFSQTYEPLEIILSDDCSSDRTFEIMQDMSANYKGKHSVRIRRNTENLGLASHINEVMKESNGEIVTWLSGDDIPIPERTEKLIEPLLYDKKVIAAHSGLTRIDIDGKILGAMPHSQKIKCINLDFICRYGTPVVTQSFIF